MTETSLIKIAIIGGGLAGATLAHALLRHNHLDVHVYESAPEFSERGAAIGLASDAQQALWRVIGEQETKDLLSRAGAVIQASTRLCIVRKPSHLSPCAKTHCLINTKSRAQERTQAPS